MTNLASINGHRNGYAKFAAQRNLELMTRLGWDPDTLTAAEINWLVGDNVIPLRAPSNGALQPDRNEAERFLTLLDPKATYFTFQTFDDDQERREARKQDLAETNAKRVAKGLHPLKLKDPFAHIIHGTLDECWDQLDRLNEQGAGIFITVNATDGKGRCKENIQQVRALFNDLDGEPLEPVLQSQQPPDIVVESSPGHFHPYRLVGGVALDQFEPLQKKLIAEFGGDDVHDLPRVMRMPGFIHRKNKDKPSLVHIVSTHEGPLYSAKDFGVVDGGNGKEPVGPYGKMRDQAKRSPTKQLNDAAMANLKAWVPELFPTAGEYHDGFRVTSADLGRDNDEDLSIVPEGIKDFGVHDLDDPREGKRTPIDIVMEWGLGVPIEEIIERSNKQAFNKACDWLRERLYPDAADETETNEPRFKLIPFRELVPGKERNYSVKGLIPRVGLTVVWGPPKCFKSFWTMDVVMHVALGREYRGRRVQQGSVVYCAFEGASGFGDRAAGFRKAYKIPAEQDVPFYLSPLRMNLVRDHEALIESIKLQIADPVIVVLDTLNRSLEGSESSDEDMGAYLNAADAIRETFNCMVIIVHHCGIDGTRPRGHTSLSGAVDAQLKVVRDGEENSASVTVEWMKDGPEGDVIESEFERVAVGVDEDGDEKATLVVKPSKTTITKIESKLDGQSATAYRLLKEAIADEGEIKTGPGFPNCPVVSIETWRRYCYAGGITDAKGKDAKKKALVRARKSLQFTHRLIRVWEDWVWCTETFAG